MKSHQLTILVMSMFSIALSACQSGPILAIRSDIPSRIEKDGTTVCERTPCNIDGDHYRDGYDWGCIGGANTKLEAFSLAPQAGFRQSKVVFGGCDQRVDVFFELTSGGVVNVVSSQVPTSKGSDSRPLSEKLSELKELRKKELITEQEFKEKRKELLDSIK